MDFHFKTFFCEKSTFFFLGYCFLYVVSCILFSVAVWRRQAKGALFLFLSEKERMEGRLWNWHGSVQKRRCSDLPHKGNLKVFAVKKGGIRQTINGLGTLRPKEVFLADHDGRTVMKESWNMLINNNRHGIPERGTIPVGLIEYEKAGIRLF